jgi:hypothetical protein
VAAGHPRRPREGLGQGELHGVAIHHLVRSTISSTGLLPFPLMVRKRSYVYFPSSAVSSRPLTGSFECQRTPF